MSRRAAPTIAPFPEASVVRMAAAARAAPGAAFILAEFSLRRSRMISSPSSDVTPGALKREFRSDFAALQHFSIAAFVLGLRSDGLEASMTDDRQDRIRQRAHAIWETQGRPHGQDRAHWDQATREVDAEEARARTTKPARAAPTPKPKAPAKSSTPKKVAAKKPAAKAKAKPAK